MTTAARRLLLLLLAALAAAALALAAPALAHAEDDDDDGGRPQDNSAVAINTKDGSSLFRLAFSIRRVAGEVVDNQNVAVAWSKCESCRTTAIAIQIVLVEGSPSTVTPVNVAVALNENCNLCQTFATAYQFVVGTNGPVEFTREGKRELWAIRRELRRLRGLDLTPAELNARVKALMERVRRLLDEELVPARGDRDDDDEDGDDDGRDDDEGGGDDDAPVETDTTVETETDTVETDTVETDTTETETTPTDTTETTTTP